MDLICNELSFYPLPDDLHQIEGRFKVFLDTFKESKSRFGFKKIRFPKNLSEQSVTTQLNFVQAVSSFSNSTIKNAILTFLAPPFFDDLNEEETETFFQSEYKIASKDCPTDEDPFGLPIAHLKSVPSISIRTHQFWENKVIEILKINDNDNPSFNVPNICFMEDLNSVEMSDWAKKSMIRLITNKEKLILFLGFDEKFDIVIQDNFFEQLLEWKIEKYQTYEYILSLMKDVEIHPFSGGMGQTENLKNRGKEASKRITNSYPDGDRLSYYVENDVITFVACKGHYNFH